MREMPGIAVLGASGLIGEAVASELLDREFPVCAIARKFTPSQRNTFSEIGVELPVVDMKPETLRDVFVRYKIGIVVNCIGVLQGSVKKAHTDFVKLLLRAMTPEMLLVHLSIPASGQDETPFARTKRSAENAIAASPVQFAIIRPGFVIARAAFGGSALMRALAVSPFELSRAEMARPMMVTAVGDIAETVAKLATRWASGERQWRESWDVMSPERLTLADVASALRRRLGGPRRRVTVPSLLTSLAACCGDAAAWLGWRPPLRSTAVAELRRGVAGNPAQWQSRLGIHPALLETAMQAVSASVQEKWFARLYLLKALTLVSLVVFWCASGLIALIAAFGAASAILATHGFPPALADATTIVSSSLDIAVGIAIAFRRTCRAGLCAGIAISLLYMAGAALLTPDLWFEPLGALVKTLPAIVLMLVALAMTADR